MAYFRHSELSFRFGSVLRLAFVNSTGVGLGARIEPVLGLGLQIVAGPAAGIAPVAEVGLALAIGIGAEIGTVLAVVIVLGLGIEAEIAR